jgi:7-cyano-7-deazaguanine synthase in queuosine biosynthesis
MQLIIGPDHLSTTLDFTIPETNIVGIFMSAGLDSTSLLCLILEELKNTNRLNTVPVIAFTVYKHTFETVYATRMIKLISTHYGIDIIHENNLTNTEPFLSWGLINSHDHIKRINEKYGKDITLYMSVNNMPPENIKKFKGRLGFVYQNTVNNYRPFLNLYKPQMINIMYKLKVEFLIPYTHSCSRQPIGKCNACYSCEERAWGFEQLGLPDPDTIDPNVAN